MNTMYQQYYCHNNFPPDFFTSSAVPPPLPPPMAPHHVALDYFMAPPQILATINNPPFEMDTTGGDGGGYDDQSPSCNYITGGCSERWWVMQRSSVDCQLVSQIGLMFDSEGSSTTSSVPKGVNTMQCNRRSKSPSSNEKLTIDQIMNKTCRYSPKEKKERIKRYKIKKNQRNFNKKIKYVCRKTLADSRTRIKGRFAKNIGIEGTNDQGGTGEGGFDHDECIDNWIFNFSN